MDRPCSEHEKSSKSQNPYKSECAEERSRRRAGFARQSTTMAALPRLAAAALYAVERDSNTRRFQSGITVYCAGKQRPTPHPTAGRNRCAGNRRDRVLAHRCKRVTANFGFVWVWLGCSHWFQATQTLRGLSLIFNRSTRSSL